MNKVMWFCSFRGWMKGGPKQMDSLCTRSAEPASPPHGQQNCPEMDICAQGRAYRKWNHTQYLWLPQGSETHWPGHPAAHRQTDRQRGRQTVGCAKFFTRSLTVHHTLRLQGVRGLRALFCLSCDTHSVVTYRSFMVARALSLFND